MRLKYSSFIWINLFLSSVGALIISLFNLSNVIYYIADGVNIILLYLIVTYSPQLRNIRFLRPFKVLLILYLLITLIGIIGNQVSALLAIWGMRNIWRFIIYFIACIMILKKEDIDNFFRFLPIIFWVNFAFAIFEYFILGCKNDYLGGLFGIAQGCNSSLIIFLNLFIAYLFSQYMYGKRKLLSLIPYIIGYFVLTIMSETKGNYLFFVIIFAICLITSRKSVKTIILSIAGVVGLAFGIIILSEIFPDSVAIIFDFDSAMDYMDENYYGYIVFTRNAQLVVTNTYFFKDSIWLYLFGYGTGACDMCSFFSSPFYDQYGYMNYRYFGAAMTTLQNGYLGLIIFFAFFVAVVCAAAKLKKSANKDFNVYSITIISYVCFSAVYLFYSSPYMDSGYWLWFIWAIPLVLLKERVR